MEQIFVPNIFFQKIIVKLSILYLMISSSHRTNICLLLCEAPMKCNLVMYATMSWKWTAFPYLPKELPHTPINTVWASVNDEA